MKLTANIETIQLGRLKQHVIEIDLTEFVDDMLTGWTMIERTRWENDGGLIP